MPAVRVVLERLVRDLGLNSTLGQSKTIFVSFFAKNLVASPERSSALKVPSASQATGAGSSRKSHTLPTLLGDLMPAGHKVRFSFPCCRLFCVSLLIVNHLNYATTTRTTQSKSKPLSSSEPFGHSTVYQLKAESGA